MTIHPSEKIITINIYQNSERNEPLQRRFEAIRRISDDEKEIIYERTLDDILETLISKYKAKEVELISQGFCTYRIGEIKESKVNKWKLILKSDKN